MRILQVVHGFPPDESGGTELLTFYLSQDLAARGHEMRVFTRARAPAAQEFSVREDRVDGVGVVRVVNNYSGTTTLQLSYENPFFNESFGRVLDGFAPDVVHFQHLAHLSVSLLPLAASLGYPTVLSLHDFFFACHRLHLTTAEDALCSGPQRGESCVACLGLSARPEAARRRFSYMEAALKIPDRVLAPSRFAGEALSRDFPFLTKRLRVVEPGIRPVCAAGHQRFAGPPLRVLYVGVLLPHKGAHVLVEAVTELAPGALEVSLYGSVVGGREEYADRLRQAALGLPVRFCGAYAHSEVGSVLSRCDVLVMPSLCEETFSLITREALSVGLPVVAARRGALPEAVEDGVNGLLFEPDSARDLARCLRRLVEEPGLLDLLGREPTRVKDGRQYAREIEEVYAEISLSPTRGKMAEPGTGLESAAPGAPAVARKEEGSPAVSVCIPTYNGEEFIARAIESVLAQTHGDFELLVVDDQSSDKTLDVARSFADPRIRLHRNETRLGVPGNWNRCLSLARAQCVCIFHQDDAMRPENLEKKLRVLEADADVVMVHSAADLVVDESAPTIPGDWMEDAAEDFTAAGREYFRKLFFRGNLICAPTVVVRRQELLEVGAFDEDLGYACDYEAWMKLCAQGRVSFLREPLVRYHWHGKNASHAFRFGRGADECLTAAQRALQYYLARGGDAAEEGILREGLDAVARLRRWTAELERGKAWLEEQWEGWKRLAEEREQVIREQRAWIGELETGKGWLAKQVEEQKAWIGELEKGRDWLVKQGEEHKAWITELEAGKAWVEKQWRHWEEMAVQEREKAMQEREKAMQARAELRENRWVQLGLRLGLMKAPSFVEPAKAEEEAR